MNALHPRISAIGLVSLAIGAGLSLFTSPARAASIDAAYVIGDVKELNAGDTGSVRLEEQELVFKRGKVTVSVPYKKVTEIEMGPATTHPSEAPIWKRVTAKKPVYRNLTINFTNAEGQDQTMTLEMLETPAAEVYDIVEIGSGQRRAGSTSQPWWGDNMWRTRRNSTEWNGGAQPAPAQPAAAAPKK